MRLNTNIASLNIYKEQQRVLQRQSSSLERISSGYKLNKAKDNPDALAQSEKLRMQIRGVQMAGRNVQDGVSMLQTAGGAVESINDMLIRIRELTVQAGNGTNSNEDKSIIKTEIEQLLKGIDDAASNTDYNGVKLIANDKVDTNSNPYILNMPIGANVDEKVEIPSYDLRSSKLMPSINVSTTDGVNNALVAIDNAISNVNSIASKYGALANRFESEVNYLAEIGDKMQGAESNLRDVDIAEEMTEYAKDNILVDAGNALMAQTNRFPQDILRILENVRK